MNRKLIVALYDVKAKLYSPPTLADSSAAACRMFQDLALDNKTLVGAHTEDFQLYHVGFYDLESGHIEPCSDLLFDGKSFAKFAKD